MAASKVQDLGTSGSSASGTTQVITLSGLAQAVAVGNHIIVSAAGGGAAPSSCADSQGNTYQLDQATSAGDPHGAIFSSKVATALNNGDTITVTYAASTSARAIAAGEFTGLASTNWFDVGTAGEGLAGTASDTGATATSAQAESLLICEVSTSAITNFAFESLTPAWVLDAEIESTGTVRGVHYGHRIVSDGPTTYAGKATWTTSRNWKTTIAVYKAAAGGGGGGGATGYIPTRIANKKQGSPVQRYLFRQPNEFTNPPPSAAAAAEVATVVVSSRDPNASVLPNAGLASVTAAALAPSVIAGTIAPAGLATVAMAALAPSASVAPNAGLAAVTAAALQPNKSVFAQAGVAAVTVLARQPLASTATTTNLYIGELDFAVDFLDKVKTATLQIKSSADQRDSTLDLTFTGLPSTLGYGGTVHTVGVRNEKAICFQRGTEILFHGMIRHLQPVDLGSGPGFIDLQLAAQDWTHQASDNAIDPRIANPVRTTVESDKARIAWLFSTFYPGDANFLNGLDSTTFVNTLVTAMPAQDFSGMNLAEALDSICSISGGTWYIDYGTQGFDGAGIPALPRLHYFAEQVSKDLTTPFGVAATDTFTSTAHGMSAGQAVVFQDLIGGTGINMGVIYYVIASGLTANAFKVSATPGGASINFTTDVTLGRFELVTAAPYAVSDTPDGVNTFGYDNFHVDIDSTEFRNNVLVIGGNGYVESFGFSVPGMGGYQNNRQGIVKDDDAVDSASGALVAAAYASQHHPRVSGTMKVWRSGLVPGMAISITSQNQHGDLWFNETHAYRINTVTAHWDLLDKVLWWEVGFGTIPEPLQDTVRKIAGDPESIAANVIAGVLKGYVGEIVGWTLATPPTGFVLCDGASYLRTGTMANLFAVISTTFGSVDANHFNVPDLRGRFPLGVDGSHALASTGGSIDHTHTGPSHTHTQPTHTHTQPTHTHTGPSHTHTGPSHSHSHNHAGPSHTHTGPSHTHTQPTHTHTFPAATASLTDVAASGGTGGVGYAGGTGQHRHTWPLVDDIIDASGDDDTGSAGTGATGSSGTGSTDTDATAGGTGATGSGGTGLTSADGDDVTGSSGGDTTGASGTGATGTNNPPYIAIHYIIRFA